MNDRPLLPIPTRNAVACGLVVATALVVYFPALFGSFHFDDFAGIAYNPHLRRHDAARHFFTQPDFYLPAAGDSVVQTYRPLVMTLYAWIFQQYGLSEVAFHVPGWLLHGAVAGLVFLLVLELAPPFWRGSPGFTRQVAWLSGLLFAVHPLAAETVNYVWALSSSMAGFLALGSLYAILQAWRTGPGPARQYGLRALAYVLFAAALLCKSTIVGLPVLVAASAWLMGKSGRRGLAEALPFLLLVAGYLVFRQDFYGELARPIAAEGRLDYLLTQLTVIPRYLALFLLPTGLNVYHNVPVTSELTVLGCLTLAMAVTSLCLLMQASTRRWAYPALWFALFLGPSSSLVPLNMKMNERRMYLPLVALVVLAALLLVRFAHSGWAQRHRTACRVWACSVLVLLAGLAVDRSLEWRTEESLWDDARRQDPTFYVPYQQLATDLYQRDDPDYAGAAELFEKAARLAPDREAARSWYFLGRIQLLTGEPERAIESLSRALAQGPDDFDTRVRLARAYRKSGSPILAQKHASKAAQLMPRRPEGHLETARALALQGAPDTEVEAAFRRFLKRAPPDHPARPEAERSLTRKKND